MLHEHDWYEWQEHKSHWRRCHICGAKQILIGNSWSDTPPDKIPSASKHEIMVIQRNVDELIRTVNQVIRLLKAWVNVYDPELMIIDLQEIRVDEPPS